MKLFLYEIRDPETNNCVYVGLTINPKNRFGEHMAPGRVKRYKDSGLQQWVQKIRSKGLRPKFVIIKELKDVKSRIAAQKIEQKHTEKLRETNKLFNKFNGAKHTKETRQWVIDGNKNRTYSKETRKKISESNSKYKFKFKGKIYIGLANISKASGLGMGKIHYHIMRKQKIKGLTYARY